MVTYLDLISPIITLKISKEKEIKSHEKEKRKLKNKLKYIDILKTNFEVCGCVLHREGRADGIPKEKEVSLLLLCLVK